MPAKTPKTKAETIEKLSHNKTLISGNIETALNKIGRACAKALNIEEVAFWQFTQNSESLTCVTSYKVGQKSGPLNENEWKMIHLSTQAGEEMLEPIPQLHSVAKIIRSFREHYDGSGYPDHLKGNQIPVSAKVLAVTDAYTSMLDNRAYRTSRLPQETLLEIQQYSGKYFDPVVVDAFNNIARKHSD